LDRLGAELIVEID